uniref:Uncharacterized protein n=1 Tax=Mucochytrium quahogii TaxID=96639 RepID=A0A7S2RFM4_9STRA|mmetsp:Transcript_637/g.1090  ORF Transcript_637/g.1090 Transcript_637/m.1090 type:complete len:161 (+) Transcript_637:37-519(+)
MSESSSSFLSSPFVAGFTSAVAVGAIGLLFMRKPSSVRNCSRITRWRDSPRSSAVLEHNGVVYVAGQVANIPTLAETGIEEQTKQTLAKVDELLELAGTDKSNILSAQIWVKDIQRDFEGMNKVWNSWVTPNSKGVRACVESRMAREHILVEVKVIAALP